MRFKGMNSNQRSSETFSEHICGAAHGSDWASLQWDVLVCLLTDGEYSAAVEEGTRLAPGESMRDLEKHRPLVQEVLDAMAATRYYNRKTNAFAMHNIAKRLKQDGIQAPRCWFPIMKILWRGGTATMDVDLALEKKFRRGRL